MKKYFAQREDSLKDAFDKLVSDCGDDLIFAFFSCNGGSPHAGFSWDGATFRHLSPEWDAIDSIVCRIATVCSALLASAPDLDDAEVAEKLCGSIADVVFKGLSGTRLHWSQYVSLYELTLPGEPRADRYLDYLTRRAKAASILFGDEYGCADYVFPFPGADIKLNAYIGCRYICKKGSEQKARDGIDGAVKAATRYLLSTVPTESVWDVPGDAIKRVTFDLSADLSLEDFMAKQLGPGHNWYEIQIAKLP